jgi:ankyrin repeat protein
MRRLLEKGAEIFEKNSNGSNVLHLAAKRGNISVLKELVRIKYPLDDPKINGITAVGIAAQRGSVDIISFLH